MLDTEEKQVLDKAHQDEDLRELREQKDVDGHLGPLEQKFIDDFHAVTSSMEKALRHVPDLHFSQELDSPEYYALKSLYMARTGRDIETGEYISGLMRQNLLNQALIYLQPVLALGLRPDFREGRVIYDKLVGQVNEVAEEIKSVIIKEAIPPRRRALEHEKEQEDGGDDGGGDGDGDGEDESRDQDAEEPAAADGSESQAKAKNQPARSIWSRLTGRDKGPEDDNAQG